jgi:hypothetical protein
MGRASTPDPFDVEALREAPLSDVTVESVLSTIPVRRPQSEEHFRVHSDPEYVLDAPLLDRMNAPERAYYWIAPIMREELAGEFRPFRVFTCFSKRGHVFLWPLKLPTEESNVGRSWSVSAMEAADKAKTLWVRMKGDGALQAYRFSVARGDLGEPQWPERTFHELVKIAFADKLIETAEHPVVRDLRGEV